MLVGHSTRETNSIIIGWGCTVSSELGWLVGLGTVYTEWDRGLDNELEAVFILDY